MQGNLPFYEFFEAFRNSGYSLGIGEYADLLRLLAEGRLVKTTDRDSIKTGLLQLCRTLWLKPGDAPYAFEDIFNTTFESSFVVAREKIKPDPAGDSAANQQAARQQQPQQQPEQKENTKAQPDVDIKRDEPDTLYFRIDTGSAKEEKEDVIQHIESDDRFLFTNNYFPVARRDIAQIFSTLPEVKMNRGRGDIDVSATINEIATSGYFKELKYVSSPETVNQLLVLQDINGSMGAFEEISEMICEVSGGVFRKKQKKEGVVKYYFQNAMDEYVYENKQLTRYLSIDQFVKVYRQSRTRIIIISDAGAARGSFSSYRIASTIKMMLHLKTISPHIVWLNPMPKSRWTGTSAARIASMVPMFELDQPGLQHAVNVLRGRQTIKLS